MEIDINKVSIDDNLDLVDNRTLINANQGNILNKVDYKIENAIFDSGLDKYILSKNKIGGGEVRLIIQEFKYVYQTKKYHAPEIINRAYDYIIGILKNSYVYKDNLIVTDGSTYDAMSIICKLYDAYENKEEFINLNNFMEYYNSKELKLTK